MRRLSEPARPAAKASSTSGTSGLSQKFATYSARIIVRAKAGAYNYSASATGSFKSPGLEARDTLDSKRETTFPPWGKPLFSRRTRFSTQRGIFHLPRNCFSPRGNPLFRKISLLSLVRIVCSSAQTLCPQGEFLRPVMKKDFPMGKSFAPIGRKP